MTKDINEVDTTLLPLANTDATSSSNLLNGNNVIARAKTDPVLTTCRCFSVVTVAASILCIIVNVIAAIRSLTNGLDIFDGIFRCYEVAIAMFVVVAETEWPFIMNSGSVAVTTRAYPDMYQERHEILLLRDIASYTLLACGLIYVISGVLCLGFLKRARQQKEFSAQQALRDLQELERRRAELEALLILDHNPCSC
ncbi:uncharacterized protein LOC143629388 [Bidens hawaiensis]|uniref:uncharacterized protein LOC143629388 n=1 Tax=Bidens hawaiensis TaxID=980011 RepID=UPI004049C80B